MSDKLRGVGQCFFCSCIRESFTILLTLCCNRDLRFLTQLLHLSSLICHLKALKQSVRRPQKSSSDDAGAEMKGRFGKLLGIFQELPFSTEMLKSKAEHLHFSSLGFSFKALMLFLAPALCQKLCPFSFGFWWIPLVMMLHSAKWQHQRERSCRYHLLQ